MPWGFESRSSKKDTSTEQQTQQQKPSKFSFGSFMSRQRMFGNQAVGRQLQAQTQMQSSGGSQVQSSEKQQSEAQPSPEALRKEALEQDRELQSPQIAEQLFQAMIHKSTTKANDYLNTDKEAVALRESVKNAARAAVEANIDSSDQASTEEKADVKAYADEIAEKANIVSNTLKDYADETVHSIITDQTKGTLLDKAKEGYNLVSPQPSVVLDKQREAAHKQAEKTAKAEAGKLTDQSIADIKQKISEQIKNDAHFLDSNVKAEDAGKADIQQRHQLNDQLVNDADIQTVYTNKLYEPIKQAVLMKLGVGRRGWRRSKELNQFRQKMKDAAREQARADIDNQIDTHALTASKGNVGKQYFGMIAKTNSYDLAKGSVDTVMEKEAEKVVNQVIPAADIKSKLKRAAKTSAYGVARQDDTASKKIRAAALSGANTKAIEVLKAKQTLAVNEARKITKGDKQTPSSGPNVEKQTALASNVKDQVTQDDIAGQSIKQAVEAPSLNSGFTKIARIIDLAVPSPGDSSSFEFELKIPVYSGSYVLFGLGGEAGKEQNELTISSEITFGAGFETFGLDANFRMGLFLESQGKDSTSALNLVSYGLYREMRNISTNAADYFWGHQGKKKSGMESVEEAELWAAMIEQQDMKEDNYVDVGLITKLQAQANAGVAEMGGSLGYKRLSRYDKKTIERLNSGGFGDTTDTDKLKEKAQAIGKGSSVRVLEASAEAAIKLAGHTLKFELEGSGTTINGKLRELNIAAKGSIPFSYGGDAAEWAQLAAKVAAPIAGSAKNVFGMLSNSLKETSEGNTNAIGNMVDLGTDMMIATPNFDEAGKQIAASLQGDETVNDTIRGWITGDSSASAIETVNKVALASSLNLNISFTKEWDAQGQGAGWKIALVVSQGKKLEIDAEVVSFSVKKSKRLGKLSFGMNEDGNLTGSFGLLN